jgi:hypothetical protein
VNVSRGIQVHLQVSWLKAGIYWYGTIEWFDSWWMEMKNSEIFGTVVLLDVVKAGWSYLCIWRKLSTVANIISGKKNF